MSKFTFDPKVCAGKRDPRSIIPPVADRGSRFPALHREYINPAAALAKG